jgi:hypothetical protein
MFRGIGLNDEAMKKWHQLFEARHPEGHNDFLCWLGLSSDRILGIGRGQRNGRRTTGFALCPYDFQGPWRFVPSVACIFVRSH